MILVANGRERSHVTSHEYDYLLYVAKNEKLKLILIEAYREVPSHLTRVKSAEEANGIYFATLPVLLRDGLKTKFQSLTRA